ncbi:MAG: UDP-N-acetylglucosamine 4,6-dehydratase family protein, partial [Clostridium sp.]
KKEIIEECQKTSAKIKIIPGVYEIMGGKISLSKMRDVDLKDLLGREEVELDKIGVSSYLEGKTVLVTGGGGSIGSELCRQIANFNPKKLLILDIYENSAYDIQNELRMNYKDLDLFTIIASVRDKKRIRKIFKEYSPDVVFHAAAHKHVPLMEDNSEEAIKNNVVGTLNVCEVCDEFNVDKFVLISTDKAVNPTNIMGATKRLCEMIVQAMNKKSKTDYVAVRFGNVLGSNGSVIPLFKNQIKNGGPVTLTHKEIIRYFMLIPEAAQLVLQAGAFAKGGEIFILDMGEPVKIYDLAKKLIKLSGFEPEVDIKIEVTGLRPGEKLYEELLMNEEGLTETENNKIFIGVPSEFDINELKLKINDLLKVAVNEDKESLKVKMKEVVPTFKEPDEANSEKKIASLAI